MDNIIPDSRHRSRLSRYLTLILRHKPNLVNMKIDEDGWSNISITEIAENILSSSNGFDWLTAESIKEIVDTDIKGRYQINSNGYIRATYGHSIKIEPLESPDQIEDLPKILFYATDDNELNELLRLGIIPGMRDRIFLHLSIRKNDALQVARHHSRFPRIVKINVTLAHATGVRFKKVSPLIVLTDEIPPQFIEGIPLPPYLHQRQSQFQNKEPRSYPPDYSKTRKLNEDKHSKSENIDLKSNKNLKSTVYFETDDE